MVCKGCGQELPLEKFYKSRWGVTAYCRDCIKAKQQAGKDKNANVSRGKNEVSVQEKPANLPHPSEGTKGQFCHFDISTLSEDCLMEELRKRGFTGTLTKRYEL